ncbi:MAG: flagellar assembly protein T N-terminal domain-containing protein [Nitrospirae bacterium]|nr:flagellar assembly protein T N-terminal domain-containing protein [Nitrospirota bacterium]
MMQGKKSIIDGYDNVFFGNLVRGVEVLTVNQKIFLKICFLAVIICFCFTPAGYLYAVTTTEVNAEGYAIIIEGRKDVARESAISNAFRRAVEQAIGVMVEAETMVKNLSLLNDNVYSKSSGYIKNYKITDEKIEGDTFRIRITASVSTKKLMKDLDDIGLLIKEIVSFTSNVINIKFKLLGD